MALPRITYNGAFTINFPRPPNILEITPFRTRLRNMSASGECETLNVNAGFNVRAVFQDLRSNDDTGSGSTTTQQYLKMLLLDFAYWAELGSAWTFAVDTAMAVNTTTDSNVVSGILSVPVASATGVVAGQYYVIETKTNAAIVQAVDSATDPVGIGRSTVFNFPSGARFRSFNYLPMLGTVRVIEKYYSQMYDVEITGEVERSSLTV